MLTEAEVLLPEYSPETLPVLLLLLPAGTVLLPLLPPAMLLLLLLLPAETVLLLFPPETALVTEGACVARGAAVGVIVG